MISTIRLAIRIAVVLPHPEGPTRTQISPAGTSRLSFVDRGRGRRPDRPWSPRGTRPRGASPASGLAAARLHVAAILPAGEATRIRSSLEWREARPRARHPWWVLVGPCTGLFVLMLDSTVVTLALPAIRRRPARLARRPAVDPERLPADPRRGRRHGGPARRHRRPPPRVRVRHGDVRRRVGRRRRRGHGGGPDRRPRDPGHRRRGAALAVARAHRARLSRRLAAAGAGDLGRGLGARARDRPARRRRADRGGELALDLLHQPAGRGDRDRDPARPRRGVARRDRTAARRPARASGCWPLGLTATVFALVQADEWGWSSPRTLALLGGGVLALFAFWIVEHRREFPLVDFSLFRNGPYFGASAAAFALVGAYWMVMYFQPQFLQRELDYSVIVAGALVLPITAPMAALLAVLGPADQPLRRPCDDDRRNGGRGRRRWCSRPSPRNRAPTSTCSPASSASASRWRSSTRRCRPPRWRRCRAQRAASRRGSWRWTGYSPGRCCSRSPARCSRRRCRPAAGARRGLRTRRRAIAWAPVIVLAIGTVLTWLFVRSPDQPREPAPHEAAHHQHHRRFHL